MVEGQKTLYTILLQEIDIDYMINIRLISKYLKFSNLYASYLYQILIMT